MCSSMFFDDFKDDFNVALSRLDYSRTGVITLDRLCPTSYQAYARGDHKSGVDVLDYKISIKEIKSTSFKTLREARESFLGSYARRMVAEADAKAKERDLKASDLAGFKKQLKRKYGNLFRAWKQGLDLSGDNQLSKGEFMKAIVNEGYTGLQIRVSKFQSSNSNSRELELTK